MQAEVLPDPTAPKIATPVYSPALRDRLAGVRCHRGPLVGVGGTVDHTRLPSRQWPARNTGWREEDGHGDAESPAQRDHRRELGPAASRWSRSPRRAPTRTARDDQSNPVLDEEARSRLERVQQDRPLVKLHEVLNGE